MSSKWFWVIIAIGTISMIVVGMSLHNKTVKESFGVVDNSVSTSIEEDKTQVTPFSTKKSPEAETVGGLSLEKAKQVFKDVCAAEDRAMREAEPMYSAAQTQEKLTEAVKYERALAEKYRSEVLAQYGITKEQWAEILTWGVKQGIELPSLQ